ncbi:hypothetical protein FB451DRAFT_61930 [Mycena latifolia]|nr:hypothetical protein FB451DRAFT_61930 [Mycena latifolia]
MADSKSPHPPTAGPSSPVVRRTVSTDTLPQYSSADDVDAAEERRRSLEDAAAPLPEGWVCHFDAHSNHHYYVDMNSTPPRSVWHHPRRAPPPLSETSSSAGPSSPSSPPSPTSPKRGLMGKFKEKMIVSKADREAEALRKAAKEEELLARYAKRRAEVLAELQRDGGPARTGASVGTSAYVGPPASPYGGVYRGLMPAPGLNNNLAGWLA